MDFYPFLRSLSASTTKIHRQIACIILPILFTLHTGDNYSSFAAAATTPDQWFVYVNKIGYFFAMCLGELIPRNFLNDSGNSNLCSLFSSRRYAIFTILASLEALQNQNKNRVEILDLWIWEDSHCCYHHSCCSSDYTYCRCSVSWTRRSD
ncbi:unnamed protein product [Linum trigynum]|uniref:Uncharacterized protein n=1 Tax=Linum trigynum TaxID=586398 RepID=A0AAV2F3W1_9ROSI